MADFLHGSSSHRLIDYIIIVGCQPSTAAARKNFVQNPKLLRRYPADDHDDFPLPHDVVFFCQPDGCLCSFDEQGAEEIDGELKTTFPFSLTEKETNTRRHGVCLNFFRKCRVGLCDEADDETEDGASHDETPISSLTSVCLLSHHSFLVSFSDCVATLRRLIEDIPVSSCCFDGGGGHVACSEWDDFLADEKSMKSRELEGWINRLLKSPVPQDGRARLELELAVQPAVTFGYPDATRLFLVDFPVYLPLELLGIDQTLKVLTAILLEHKVVLISSDYQVVSTCVMAFIVYLYPLEYVYTVIPLLPTAMPHADTLMQSPAPFLIGVPASFFHSRRGVTKPNDVWLVDLDSQTIHEPQIQTQLPVLPEVEVKSLSNKLNKAMESLDSLQVSQDHLEVHKDHHTSHIDVDSGCDPMAIDVAIRVAFIQFILSPGVLGGLKPYLRCLRLFPKPVVAQQKVFFLRLLIQEHGKQGSSFLKQLVSTQSVDCFGEWYYLCSSNSAVMRIVQDRMTSPEVIGDKPKYYLDDLISLPFSVFESSSPLGEAMLELKAKDPLQDMSLSRSISSSSMSSVSSLYQIHTAWPQFRSHDLDTMFPADSTEDLTTAVDTRRLLTDASNNKDEPGNDTSNDEDAGTDALSDGYDGDFDDAFMHGVAVPNDDFKVLELQDFSERLGSTSSSVMSPVVKCFPQLGINRAILRLAHVDMPSNSTDPYSEVDTVSLEPEKWEKLDQAVGMSSTPPTTEEASDSRNATLVMPDIAMPVFTGNDSDGLKMETIVSKSEVEENADQTDDTLKHPEVDLVTSASSTHQHHETLGVNFPGNRLASDPGPPPNSPLQALEEPGTNNRLRTYSDPQFIRESPDVSGDEFPLPPTRKNTAMFDSYVEPPLMRSRSLDDVSALETLDSVDRRRKSVPLNPRITVTNEFHLPVVIQADWSNGTTPGGDRRLLSYHVIRRTVSMSPELTEIDGRERVRRFSSGSSSSSFRAETFIVRALSRKSTRTIKQRWQSAYGTDMVPHVSQRRSLHRLEWEDDNRIQMEARKRMSLPRISRRDSPVMVESEDQREAQKFVLDVVNSALKGSGIGFFNSPKLRRVLVDEQLRYLVCSRILEASKAPHGVQVTDVWLARSVYKGVLALVRACIAGLETGVETQCQSGIGSAFLLLEIAYTHFTGKDETATDGKTKAEIEIGKTLKRNESQKHSQDTRPVLVTSESLPGRVSVRNESEEFKQDTRPAVVSSLSLPDAASVSSVSISSMSANSMGESSDYSDVETRQTADVRVARPMPEFVVEMVDGNTQSSASVEAQEMLSIHSMPVERQDMLSVVDTQFVGGGIKRSATFPRRTPPRRSPKVFLGPAVHSFDDDLSGSEEIILSGDFRETSPDPGDYAWRDSRALSPVGSDDFQLNKKIKRRQRKQDLSTSRSEQYMYKELVGKGRSRLWDYGEFWTALFLDTVAAERSAVGLVEMPLQLIDRHKSASGQDRKAMETEEDNILSSVLHNLAAFMLSVSVSKEAIRKRVNRYLGQAHLGLNHTQIIYDLLDSLKNLNGNDVELQPLCSKMQCHKEFMVHIGSTFTAPTAILVVTDRCLLVKSIKRYLLDRFWYEDIIKVNFHPSSESLIMWHRGPQKNTLQQSYCTRNCRELYTLIQTRLKHAALTQHPVRGSETTPKEYIVRDLNSGDGGSLSVSLDGIECQFVERVVLIPLHNIKDCSSHADIFEVEEDDGQECRVHRFASPQCSAICQAVISVFSLVAAQQSQRSQSPVDT